MAWIDKISTPPAVIAHCGLHGKLRPENSVDAVEAAIASGVDGIALDVRLSKDRVPMVFRDPMLDRMTPVHGQISSMAADALTRINLRRGRGGAEAGLSGSYLPRLTEVLAAVGDQAAMMLYTSSRACLTTVAAQVYDAGLSDMVRLPWTLSNAHSLITFMAIRDGLPVPLMPRMKVTDANRDFLITTMPQFAGRSVELVSSDIDLLSDLTCYAQAHDVAALVRCTGLWEGSAATARPGIWDMASDEGAQGLITDYAVDVMQWRADRVAA